MSRQAMDCPECPPMPTCQTVERSRSKHSQCGTTSNRVHVLMSGNDRGIADTRIEPWGCCTLGYFNVPIQVICTAKSEMYLFREWVFYHGGYPTLRTPLLTYMLTYIFIVFPLVVEICFWKDEVAWNSFTCIHCSVLHWLSQIHMHCVSQNVHIFILWITL